MADVELFHTYRRLGISTIPCARVWDPDNKEYTGKRTVAKNWSMLCDELPEEEQIDSWKDLTNIWGIAAVTGIASNLCCIDVDTEDVDLQKRIMQVVPYTPVWVNGNGKRMGKFIYRLTDNPASYRQPAQTKIKIPYPFLLF